MARSRIPAASAAVVRHLADGEGRLAVRATPNASEDAILLPITHSTEPLMRTTAMPEGDGANKAILRLIADALGKPASALQLLRGGVDEASLCGSE